MEILLAHSTGNVGRDEASAIHPDSFLMSLYHVRLKGHEGAIISHKPAVDA